MTKSLHEQYEQNLNRLADGLADFDDLPVAISSSSIENSSTKTLTSSKPLGTNNTYSQTAATQSTIEPTISNWSFLAVGGDELNIEEAQSSAEQLSISFRQWFSGYSESTQNNIVDVVNGLKKLRLLAKKAQWIEVVQVTSEVLEKTHSLERMLPNIDIEYQQAVLMALDYVKYTIFRRDSFLPPTSPQEVLQLLQTIPSDWRHQTRLDCPKSLVRVGISDDEILGRFNTLQQDPGGKPLDVNDGLLSAFNTIDDNQEVAQNFSSISTTMSAEPTPHERRHDLLSDGQAASWIRLVETHDENTNNSSPDSQLDYEGSSAETDNKINTYHSYSNLSSFVSGVEKDIVQQPTCLLSNELSTALTPQLMTTPFQPGTLKAKSIEVSSTLMNTVLEKSVASLNDEIAKPSMNSTLSGEGINVAKIADGLSELDQPSPLLSEGQLPNTEAIAVTAGLISKSRIDDRATEGLQLTGLSLGESTERIGIELSDESLNPNKDEPEVGFTTEGRSGDKLNGVHSKIMELDQVDVVLPISPDRLGMTEQTSDILDLHSVQVLEARGPSTHGEEAATHRPAQVLTSLVAVQTSVLTQPSTSNGAVSTILEPIVPAQILKHKSESINTGLSEEASFAASAAGSKPKSNHGATTSHLNKESVVVSVAQLGGSTVPISMDDRFPRLWQMLVETLGLQNDKENPCIIREWTPDAQVQAWEAWTQSPKLSYWFTQFWLEIAQILKKLSKKSLPTNWVADTAHGQLTQKVIWLFGESDDAQKILRQLIDAMTKSPILGPVVSRLLLNGVTINCTTYKKALWVELGSLQVDSLKVYAWIRNGVYSAIPYDSVDKVLEVAQLDISALLSQQVVWNGRRYDLIDPDGAFQFDQLNTHVVLVNHPWRPYALKADQLPHIHTLLWKDAPIFMRFGRGVKGVSWLGRDPVFLLDPVMAIAAGA